MCNPFINMYLESKTPKSMNVACDLTHLLIAIAEIQLFIMMQSHPLATCHVQRQYLFFCHHSLRALLKRDSAEIYKGFAQDGLTGKTQNKSQIYRCTGQMQWSHVKKISPLLYSLHWNLHS